jgi:hypothetical protein
MLKQPIYDNIVSELEDFADKRYDKIKVVKMIS